MEERVNLKELSDEQIDNLSDIQLYNIVFGPVIKWKSEINLLDEKEMQRTVVAVYGATVVPIKRRIEKLISLISFKKPKLVIFSGGFAWDGIKPKLFSKEEIHEKWKTESYINTIRRRANDFIKHYPDLKKIAYDEIKEKWLEMEENANKKPVDFDEYFNQIVDESKDDILQRMEHDKTIYENLKKEYNKDNVNRKENDKQEFSLFRDWLKKYVYVTFITQYTINNWTEADFMKRIYASVYQVDDKNIEIELDTTSNDTSENAENCLKITQRKDAKYDNFIVINEWPYILRAVLSTSKMTKEMDYKINILGAGADARKDVGVEYESLQEYRDNPVSGLRTQVRKMARYEDVPDFDITDYIGLKSIINGGPSVMINKKYMNFEIQNLDL